VISTKDVSKETSSYAEEGTMLHAVVEECLTLNEHTIPEATKLNFNIADDESKELVEAVQEVLDWVVSLRLKYADYEDAYEVVEQRVYMSPYIKATGCQMLNDVHGTLDYSFIIPSAGVVYIVDWKFGKGVEVWPDSEQLYAYALGKLASVKFEVKKVFLVIGQPRLYSGELFKIVETTPEALKSWLVSSLVPALNNSMSKHPIYKPTEKACMWCAIKRTCKYRKDMAMQAAADVFKIHAKLPDKTDDEELSDFLFKLPDLKKYISDIELYAMNILRAGRDLPKWKLVAGRSIRKWKDEKEAKLFYANLEEYDAEDLTITKFKSPTQIEKLVGKKNVTEEMLALVVKPPGKPTLVRETDKRPALEFETAEDKFKSYVED
jgi:hypothetical protein